MYGSPHSPHTCSLLHTKTSPRTEHHSLLCTFCCFRLSITIHSIHSIHQRVIQGCRGAVSRSTIHSLYTDYTLPTHSLLHVPPLYFLLFRLSITIHSIHSIHQRVIQGCRGAESRSTIHSLYTDYTLPTHSLPHVYPLRPPVYLSHPPNTLPTHPHTLC